MGRLSIVLLTFLIPIYTCLPILVQGQNQQNSLDKDPSVILKAASAFGLKPEQVIELSNQALTLLSNSDRPDLIAQSYILLGKANYSLNKYGSSIDFYKKAELIYVKLGDSTSVCSVMNNIGNSYQMKSEYGLAIEYFQKALRLCGGLKNDKYEASILNNLGIVYQITGRYNESLDCLNQALSYFDELNDKAGYSSAENNIGITYNCLGKYQEALVWFNKCIKIKKELKDTLNLASTYESLGQVYEKMDSDIKALEIYKMSLQLQERIENYNGATFDYISLARVNLKIKNYRKAFDYLANANKLVKKNENYLAEKDIYKLLSDYYLAIGDPLQSRAMLIKYISISEKIFDKNVSDRIAEITVQNESEQKEYQNKLLLANLEIEKYKLRRSRDIQFFFIVISLIVSSLLIYTLYFLKKLRLKNDQIEKINIELNNFNLELEEKVDERTKELRDALKKADESDKLKSAFLANMSHEIRTPMNGIIGFAKVLEDDNLSESERRKYLNVIKHQGQSLMQTINDIISLSKIETGQMEIKSVICNANKIVDNLNLMFRGPSYLNKKSEIILKVVKPLKNNESNFVSDSIRIEQILRNLIDNAFKYTNEGEIEFGYTIEKRNTINFYVTDTGLGIPDDQLDKVFNRFYKYHQGNHPLASGAGLGLSISKKLAYLLGGDLDVESKLNFGSRFCLSIPYISADMNVEDSMIKLGAINSTQSWPNKIALVVEDDNFSFQYIEVLLKETGLTIVHVKNGEDAVNTCRSNKNIDIVLMDIQLPFMTGYEATQQIRAIRYDLPIIVQSANVLNDERVMSIKAGCNYFISKPIDSDELYSAISKCLDVAM